MADLHRDVQYPLQTQVVSNGKIAESHVHFLTGFGIVKILFRNHLLLSIHNTLQSHRRLVF